MVKVSQRQVSRRDAVKAAGLVVAAAPFASSLSKPSAAHAQSTDEIEVRRTVEAPAGVEPRPGGEFRWGQGFTNRPPLGLGTVQGSTNQLLYSQLWDLLEDMSEFVPDLAESWSLSDDGTTLDISLRQGVTWHDGAPFTARDVEFSFRVACHPDAASPAGQRFGLLATLVGVDEFVAGITDDIAGVQMADDYSVTLQFNSPWAAAMYQLSRLAIIAEHLFGQLPYEEINTSLEWADNPIGTGPFKFGQRVELQFTEYVAFDDYWAGRPYLDKVISVDFESSDTAALALENGEIDFLYNPAGESLQRLREIPSLVTLADAGGFCQALEINTVHPTLSDKRIRQALFHAIDREAIVNGILTGRATPTDSMFPPSIPEWTHAGIPQYPYDVDRAKALLEEAGWDSSTEIELLFYYDTSEARNLMSAIQQYWDAAGVKSTPRYVADAAEEEARVSEDFQVMYVGAASAIDPDDLLGLYTVPSPQCSEPSSQTATRYCNSELVDQYDMERIQTDEDERKRYVDRWQEIYTEDLPHIPLWEPYRFSFLRQGFYDFTFAVMGGNRNAYYGWHSVFYADEDSGQ